MENQSKNSNENLHDSSIQKMPAFDCSCGCRILIVPDLFAMNNAIKDHIKEHKQLTGKVVTEQFLADAIIVTLAKDATIDQT